MAVNIAPLVSIAELAKHPKADEFGIAELIDNGYEDNFKDHYVFVEEFDQTTTTETLDAVMVIETRNIEIGEWSNGCLYSEYSIVAVKIEGREGWWELGWD